MEKGKHKKLNHFTPKSSNELIIGPRAILEAIAAEKSIDKILISRELSNEQSRQVVQEAQHYQIPVQKVPIEKLLRLTRKTHQGMIALAAPISFAHFEHEVESAIENGFFPLVLLLDGVTDVRNFGAIARSAEALGAEIIVVPAKNAARIGEDAMKTSAGALNHIKVAKAGHLKDVLLFLQSYGYQIVACTEKGNLPVFNVDFSKPTAIVMGAEETGIANELIRVSDVLAYIPMTGKIASLNVSAATTVVLYEAVRQKNIALQ
jgi:23S rRNA (guanosine2251-2'-O)-methyltransferase